MKKLSRRNFLAAAIFGTVAGSAIVKGMAVAGDSFKPKRKRKGKGKAYPSTSDKPYIQEEGRDAPLPVDVEISFKDRPQWFSEMFLKEWKKGR